MDWIEGISRLGFPVMSAVALAWALNSFIHRREKEAADRETALTEALSDERKYIREELSELVGNYHKIANEAQRQKPRRNTADPRD